MGLVAPLHVKSSHTGDRTHVPCIGRQIFNHRTTREVWFLPFLWGRKRRKWTWNRNAYRFFIQGVSPNISGEPRCEGENRDLKEEVNTEGGGAGKWVGGWVHQRLWATCPIPHFLPHHLHHLLGPCPFLPSLLLNDHLLPLLHPHFVAQGCYYWRGSPAHGNC